MMYFFKRAGEVMLGEGILLKEFTLDDIGNL